MSCLGSAAIPNCRLGVVRRQRAASNVKIANKRGGLRIAGVCSPAQPQLAFGNILLDVAAFYQFEAPSGPGRRNFLSRLHSEKAERRVPGRVRRPAPPPSAPPTGKSPTAIQRRRPDGSAPLFDASYLHPSAVAPATGHNRGGLADIPQRRNARTIDALRRGCERIADRWSGHKQAVPDLPRNRPPPPCGPISPPIRNPDRRAYRSAKR